MVVAVQPKISTKIGPFSEQNSIFSTFYVNQLGRHHILVVLLKIKH